MRVPSSQVHTELPHCPCPEHWFGQTSYKIISSISVARRLISVALSDELKDDWKMFNLHPSCISSSLSSAQFAKLEETCDDDRNYMTIFVKVFL